MSKRTHTAASRGGAQELKRLGVSGLLVGGFVLYSLIHGRSAASALANSSVGSAPSTSPPTATTGSDGTAAPSATTATSSGYKNGTYTGGVADAQWGYVQVKVIIANGRMTDVRFVQYPNDRNRSIMINQYADPILDQEAIQAQGAQVDVISGATDTSFAFMQSLDDALSQAQS